MFSPIKCLELKCQWTSLSIVSSILTQSKTHLFWIQHRYYSSYHSKASFWGHNHSNL
jgi:hypothetical protein